MKYRLGFKRTDYAWVEVEAESFEDAKAKAEKVEIAETDWVSRYFDTELVMIKDEKGNEEYYA